MVISKSRKCGVSLPGGKTCQNKISGDKGATACHLHQATGKPARGAVRAHGDKNTAAADFHTNNERRVSVLSEGFTDVLIDRYGDDPREIDKEASRLFLKHREATLAHAKNEALLRKRASRNPRSTLSNHELEYAASLKNEADKAEREYRQYVEDNPVEWPQYFLVNNANGHLHNNLGCSTLHWNTSLMLYTPASGMEQDEAVELAGHRVCTVCVPEAPTNIMDMETHVLSDKEREDMEYRERREQQRREREQEKQLAAEKRAAREKKRAAGRKEDALDEPITIPSMTSDFNGGGPFEEQEVSTAKDLRSMLKNTLSRSVTNARGLSPSYSKQDSMNVVLKAIESSGTLTDAEKQQRVSLVERNWSEPHGFLVSDCYGDIDQQVKNFESIRAGVESLAAAKGKPFNKMLDDVFGKRTMKSIHKDLEHFVLARMLKDCPRDPKDMVDERVVQFKQWVDDPESFRTVIR